MKKKNSRAGNSGQNENGSVQKRNVRRLWMVVANTLILFALYRIAITAGERIESALPYKICTVVMAVALCALFCIYFVLNRGFGKKQTADLSLLPSDWSADKKQEYAKKEEKRASTASSLMLWIIPILIVLLLDFLDLFVVEYFRYMFSGLK